MDELYKQYGALMVKLEILNGQIQRVKQQIQEGLNNQVNNPDAGKVEKVKNPKDN